MKSLDNPPPFVQQICKIQQGADCCKYLLFGVGEGWQCAKEIPGWVGIVNAEWAWKAHIAQGNNCPCVTDLETAIVPPKEEPC